MAFRRRVERRRDGSFTIRLGDDERRLLGSLPGQLAALVDAEPEDPWLQRLFPTAYPKDPEREQEWRLLMSVDLHDRRRSQLATLAETAGATSLTEEQMHLWSQALNDLRLYLGTRLDLSEETTDEDFADKDDRDLFILYSWLGFLQEETIEALSKALPPGGGPKPLPPDPPPS
jgi:hypothetical protein